MSENNTNSFKNLLIILGVIFSIFFFAVVFIFSFSDFEFLNGKGLKIEQRLQYGISAAQTTGTIVAGIAVFFNAYQASRSANAANENAKSVYKNAQAAEDKQITDRFSKAIELLGNKEIEVKLGGIYALEQIAKDSPEKYHWTIMEVLTAFVRENAPLKKEEEGEKEEIPKLRTDIQAALTVIGRRNCEKYQGTQRLDLSNIDIRGANLREAYLEGANFWKSNLQEVDLSEAHLQKAYLFGIKLQNANLNNTNLQDVVFSKANLKNADLTNAKLQGAKLFEANLQYVVLYEANLQGANLNQANLQDAFLGEANLQEANFNQASLQGADLKRSKNIENQQIILANGDEHTILPDFINKPMNWS